MYIKNDELKKSHSGIWVVCDLLGEELLQVSLELLGAAVNLAEKKKQAVCAVVMGNEPEKWVNVLWEHGADKIIIVNDPSLAVFHDEDQALILCRLIDKYKPEIILAGASAVGRALIPRVAVMSKCGLTADCTELDIDPESGALLQTRPAFGGSLMATIRSDQYLPQIATVRPGVMSNIEPRAGFTGELVREKMLDGDFTKLKRVLEELKIDGGSNYFGNSAFIIAGGRGMKGPEGFELLERFAKQVDGAVGATRAAVDAGWAPYSMQIGQTGRTVQPKVYIACGISGQIQHLVGMQSSDTIIAINKDKNAPIMKLADIAVVGDIFEILPEIINQLKVVH